jgi:Uma2 family endonuclease
MSTPVTTPSAAEIEYPDCDGRPMSGNTLQYRWIVTIQGNLDALFRDRDDVFVAGDLLWYPVEGDNVTRTAPDALVAFGRPKGDRGSYQQWKEGGVAPQVVWEILSPGNRRGELRTKFEFYQRFGVEEYYQYDPDRGRLRGWLRREAELEEIENIVQGWRSPATGVTMRLEHRELILTYPDGRPFLSFLELAKQNEELQAKAAKANARAARERRAREAAEARATEAAARATEAVARATEAAALAERRAIRMRELGIDPDA